MALNRQTIWCLLFSLFISCEETLPSPEGNDTGLIVVEAVITNENRPHAIRLSRAHQSQNEISTPIKGAQVQIKTGNVIIPATETTDSAGLYLTSSFRAITGQSYTLVIRYEGQEYTATDQSVPVEALEDIHLIQSNNSFKVDFRESGTQANYIEHHFNWENTSACIAGSCKGLVVYYDLKNIDVNEVFKPEQTDFTFPKGTQIIRRKFSVSPAYRDFLRGLLLETEWSGGAFGVTRSNVNTNLSEGAVGFFAVATVVSDTTIAE